MPNEIRATYDTGFTLYVLVFNAAGQVWRNNAPQQFLAYAPGAIGVYDIPLSEIATNSGEYRADWPTDANMIEGIYSVVLFEQAGGGPVAADDEHIGATATMYWDGSAEITHNMMDTVLDTIAVNTGTTLPAEHAAILAGAPNTWYVSKAGIGGAGASWSDAFDTISAAVAAAITEDKIIVGPGTYNEQVDILTATKSLVLEGVDKNTCILTNAATPTLDMYDRCTLRNMQIINTNAAGHAVTSRQDNVTIEDCIITGTLDGLVGSSSTHLTLRRCRISGTYDGANFLMAAFVTAEDCVFITDGTYVGFPCDAVYIPDDTGYSVFRRCWFYAQRTDLQTESVFAFRGGGYILLDHCRFEAEVTQAACTANVTGIMEEGISRIRINDCQIITLSAGAGTVMDIEQRAGHVSVDDTDYDVSKTTGTIIDSTKAITDYILSDVIGADSDTLESLSDQLDVLGAGSGGTEETYTVTDAGTGLPIDGVHVWVTTDLAGANIIWAGFTNAAGVVKYYHDLATGTTVYLWRELAGYRFDRPDSENTL